MKKKYLIWLLRYSGIVIFITNPIMIYFNISQEWGIPFEVFLLSGLVSIILMASANNKDFGYPTTVDIKGIPVPPLREPDTEYHSNGFIVTATKKTSNTFEDDDA